MTNYTFFRLFNIFMCFVYMLFPLFLIHFAHGNILKSNDVQMRQLLRPLKYNNNCTKFCDNVVCQPIDDCDVGVILNNATYCGCCEACVKFLDIGDNCIDIIDGPLALGSQARCKIGTTCENGKCTLDTNVDNSCLRHQDIRRKHNEIGKYESEIWVPECDKEGYYKAIQEISRSICTDKNGNKIFGSADDLLNNTCACSRYIQEKFKKNPISFYLKPQEHCTSSGSFDNLQCIGNLCYCADMNTGHIKSELVRIDFLQNLNCFNSKIHEKEYLGDCEKELQRTKKLAYEFRKKNVRIYGLDKVKCDPDGTFSPVQCLPDTCVCTDKMGSGISTYKSDVTHLINMTCNCARDGDSEHFPSFACNKHGSFQPVTCFGAKCVCVDENGENIALKEQNISEKGASDICSNVIRDLLDYPGQIQPEEDTS